MSSSMINVMEIKEDTSSKLSHIPTDMTCETKISVWQSQNERRSQSNSRSKSLNKVKDQESSHHSQVPKIIDQGVKDLNYKSTTSNTPINKRAKETIARCKREVMTKFLEWSSGQATWSGGQDVRVVPKGLEW
ncbi:hypothetical protein Tco_0706888 [Tanacetum coccineum]|uniref:Uncharacterized protein n=1 Tax=Tanacetum coccineum TaxID=301880 RepID=A0ABQ4YA92_9ASTR